jgi:CspA family cold shock protein
VEHNGTVIWFSSLKGFGFIEWSIDGKKQEDLFVHFSDVLVNGFKTLNKGQKVTFKIGTNKRDQPKAIEVTPAK